MSGIKYLNHADLGGMACGKAILGEPEGRPLRSDWEARALALTLAMGATGGWNLDTSRSARETLPDYARLGYYEIWLGALERLLLERGWIQADELADGLSRHPSPPAPRVLCADQVGATLARGAPTGRAASRPARFAVGQRVRTRLEPVDHHTRLPGYARGKTGVIGGVHGVHVYPDTHAHGLGEQPQWLYSVVFSARALWGQGAHSVAIDAWEPYLEAA